MYIQDGLYAERLPDGSVRLEKRDGYRPDAPVQSVVVLPENIWRSLICGVSRDGEDRYRWYVAGAFHNGSDSIATNGTMPGADDAIHALAATEAVRS